MLGCAIVVIMLVSGKNVDTNQRPPTTNHHREFTAWLCNDLPEPNRKRPIETKHCRQRKTTNRRLENESFSRDSANDKSDNRHTAARMTSEDHFPIVKGTGRMKKSDDACCYLLLSKYVLM